MNDAFGSMALHYEINPRTGEIRMTGSRQNQSGGRTPNPGNNGSSNNSGSGWSMFAAIVTMTVCVLSGFSFFTSLFFSFLGALVTRFFMKK